MICEVCNITIIKKDKCPNCNEEKMNDLFLIRVKVNAQSHKILNDFEQEVNKRKIDGVNKGNIIDLALKNLSQDQISKLVEEKTPLEYLLERENDEEVLAQIKKLLSQNKRAKRRKNASN